MKRTKFPDPPTEEEFFEAISSAWKPGIRDDCRRIEKWVDEGGAVTWEGQIRGQIKRVRNELAAGKSDALVATAHMALWTAVRSANRESDRPFLETGKKVREGGKAGGRPKGGTIARDIELAREFTRRRPSSRTSDSALKEKIGAERGLKRSASIDAVNRGLKKLSG